MVQPVELVAELVEDDELVAEVVEVVGMVVGRGIEVCILLHTTSLGQSPGIGAAVTRGEESI